MELPTFVFDHVNRKVHVLSGTDREADTEGADALRSVQEHALASTAPKA